MPIFLPPKSLATNSVDTIDLYSYRLKYKRDILVNKLKTGRPPEIGTADLWYDRSLYGKIDRHGNIIIPRESLLRPLRTRDHKTYYTLDFVSLAFGQMVVEMAKYSSQNLIPNQQTIFKSISPIQAWAAPHQPYHQYMVGIFDGFVSSLDTKGIQGRVKNFNDFVEEFYTYVRDYIVASGSPFTFSSFIAGPLTPPYVGGLIIDLSRADPADDWPKQSLFINDINFNFYKNLANKFGFAVDRNIPWRLIANLNSKSMQTIMAQPAFNTTYQYGPRNVFDRYYTKTFILDYSLLSDYMYVMYTSLLQYKPTYPESTFYVCKTNVGGILDRNIQRVELLDYEKENIYTYKDYWMEKTFRFRLLELKHNLEEEDIKYIMKRAKVLYTARSPDSAYKYLNSITKRFFLAQHNFSKT